MRSSLPTARTTSVPRTKTILLFLPPPPPTAPSMYGLEREEEGKMVEREGEAGRASSEAEGEGM